jgi:hypothetical protein
MRDNETSVNGCFILNPKNVGSNDAVHAVNVVVFHERLSGVHCLLTLFMSCLQRLLPFYLFCMLLATCSGFSVVGWILLRLCLLNAALPS